jgi:hypothetical protein
LTGFETGEIDVLLDGSGTDEEDELPVVPEKVSPVTRVGDQWVLDEHRVICADALAGDSYTQLLGSEKMG